MGRKGQSLLAAAFLAACGGGVAQHNSSDDGGGTGSGCSSLAACCTQLSGYLASLCHDIVGSSNAQDCTTELGQLQSEGHCGNESDDASTTGSSSGSGGGSTGSSSSGGSSSSSGGTGSGSSSGGGVAGDAAAGCPTVVLQSPQSVQDIVSAVQGRWMICEYLSSLFPTWAPSDTVGMEFSSATAGGGSCGSGSTGCMGGLVYFLVQGASGLTRGSGNGYQIWYSIDTSLELTLAQSPNNGTWSTSVSVSSSPREFWIEQLSYMDGPRLVAAQ